MHHCNGDDGDVDGEDLKDKDVWTYEICGSLVMVGVEVMQGAFKGGILTSPPPPHCDKTIVEGPSQPAVAMSVTILSFGTYRVFLWLGPPFEKKTFSKWGREIDG